MMRRKRKVERKNVLYIISGSFDNLYKNKIILTKINFYIFRRKKKNK